MARSDPKKPGPGSIADTVAHLAIWARRAPRGFGHVEYHSEYARAEADRRLGEVLLREQVPYHHVELPVWVTPSQAGRHLLEHLEKIDSGTVSITGFATAVAEEDRRDLLAILSVRREVLADLGLCQIWWLTPDFREKLLHVAPDLDSWFMVRLKLEEEFLPKAGEPDAAEPLRPTGPTFRIDEALRRAASLVERFQRAKDGKTPESELVALAASAADAISEVGAPKLTRGLADRLVSGLTEACRQPLVECLSTTRNLARFGLLFVTHGRGKEAAPLIDRLLTMVEQDERPDHPDIIRNLLTLAEAQIDTKRPLAEVLYRRALEIAERIHGPGHPDIARCLRSRARLLGKASQLKEAESLGRRALAIDQESLGPNHPDVASDLSNLASVLRTAGRLAEAETLYRRALAIDERSLGPDHPSVATDLVNLAVLLQDAGRPAEAEPLLRRALAIDETIYEPEHPSIVRDRNHLASLLRATNRPGEAEVLQRRLTKQ